MRCSLLGSHSFLLSLIYENIGSQYGIGLIREETNDIKENKDCVVFCVGFLSDECGNVRKDRFESKKWSKKGWERNIIDMKIKREMRS